MSAKPLDIIVGQPTTESMDRMTEQMAQMVAPVKTTAWGGLHGSLALVLDDTDYAIVTRGVITATNRVDQPPAVHPNIDDQTTQRELLRLQAETKKLQTAFDLQEAVTNIGVQRIIDSVEEQYVEELNEDYFGYANQTIKSVLAHLRTKWCKVMTKERTDARCFLPHVGTKHHTRHHLRSPTHKTSKEVPYHQRHHLRRSQNPTLCRTDV